MYKTLKKIISTALSASMVLGVISVTPATTRAEGAKIDVWDFGCNQESDTALYNNKIPLGYWTTKGHDGSNNTMTVAKMTATSPLDMGGLSFYFNGGDRLSFLDASGARQGVAAATHAALSYPDKYSTTAYYNVNSSAYSAARGAVKLDADAGSVITLYGGTLAGGSATDYVVLTKDGKEIAKRELGILSAARSAAMLKFIIPESGSYLINYGPGGTALRPIIARVTKTPPVTVTGSMDLAGLALPQGYELSFVENSTHYEYKATLDGTSFTAALPADCTFTAKLSHAVGFGFTNNTKIVTTNAEKDTILNGMSVDPLVVEEKSTYVFSGSIQGFAADYDKKTDISITMKTPEDSPFDDVPLTIDKNALTFTATLEPDVKYTAELTGVNDYLVKAGGTVSANMPTSQNIILEKKPTYRASGSFKLLKDGNIGKYLLLTDDTVSNLPSDSVTALSFKNVADGYTYPTTLTGGNGYEVNLRDGSYEAVATISGHRTVGHVVVSGKTVTKDLLFTGTTAPTPLEKKANLYVGYPDKAADNFHTVQEALNAVRRMNPTSEDQRITLHIAPGVYRGQLTIETPYVTLINDEPEKGDAVLSGYYGIGYVYYSAKNGFYDAEAAFDKYDKGIVSNWGPTVFVKPTATYFKAKNIVFESSFNRYITDEEIADGVELSMSEAIRFVRTYGADVRCTAAIERAAAMYIQSDMSEFYKCSFLSSQDTLGTGSNAVGNSTKVYYKNCYIEGATDFICGGSNSVFDQCTLSAYGRSDTATGSTLTAANNGKYFFYNCTVIKNPDSTMKVAESNLGRPWGAPLEVFFYNTKLDASNTVAAVGWVSMSGTAPTAPGVTFKEFGTTLMDGTAVSTAGRAVVALAQDPNPKFSDYFNSWIPSYYQAEAETLAFTQKPLITDNGDINIPKQGHTLTVRYSLGQNDANDLSLINWYRVKDGNETLIKTSLANLSKTYQVQAGDVGYNIKVVVTPKTATKTEAAEAYTVVGAVVAGYEDPSKPGEVIPPGEGINVWLAGDSTVKDYKASGVFSSNRDQNEGSWGEFLQYFYAQDQVKVINYANGGRGVRSFMNDTNATNYAAIAAGIKKGDYLFIQFGHNDTSTVDPAKGTFLGVPNASGVYPTIAAVKDGTTWPAPSGIYTNINQSGTYKWYLGEYVKMAKQAGAIPIIVTPVSRLYWQAGNPITIKPHHKEDIAAGDEINKDGYVIACRQVGEELGVNVIDLFELSKKFYIDTYKSDPAASGTDSATASPLSRQYFNVGDSTHHSKAGGFVMAEFMIMEIQKLGFDISKVVKLPSSITSKSNSGDTALTVSANGTVTAYTQGSSAGNYSSEVQPTVTAVLNANLKTIANGGSTEEESADYTELDRAITAANQLNGALYENLDNVTQALADVNQVRGLKKSQQQLVDAMTARISTAIESLVRKPVDRQKTIWVIGDSTASAHLGDVTNADYLVPRLGWGEKLSGLVKNGSNYIVKNIAASGRSSKSYPTQNADWYADFAANVGVGDVLILGFGHNDEFSGSTYATHYSDPNLPSSYAGQSSSFKANLKNLYIDIARSKGADVILFTPIVRRNTSNNYTNNTSVHITVNQTANGVTYSGGDYPQAIRDLAKEFIPNLPVVDLTEQTKALYVKLGAEKVVPLLAQTTTAIDNTHTSALGAEYNAYLVATNIVSKNMYGLGQIFNTLKAPAIPGVDGVLMELALTNVQYNTTGDKRTVTDVQYKVSNSGDAARGRVMMSIYDTTGKQVYVQFDESKVFNKGDNAGAFTNLNIAEEISNPYTIKLFLWTSEQDMIPLAKPVTSTLG